MWGLRCAEVTSTVLVALHWWCRLDDIESSVRLNQLQCTSTNNIEEFLNNSNAHLQLNSKVLWNLVHHDKLQEVKLTSPSHSPFAYIFGTIKYSPDLRAAALKIYSIRVTLCMHNAEKRAKRCVDDFDVLMDAAKFVATLPLVCDSQLRVPHLPRWKYDRVFPFMLRRT